MTTNQISEGPLCGPLLPHHRQDLQQGSGLSDETIIRAGLFSEQDAAKLQALLRWDRPATTLCAALVFPFRRITGEFSGFARIRPDSPRLSYGKPVKYEQPSGEPNRAYFPFDSIAAIHTPRAILGIVEGEKKALAACQAGVPCIGICGVWNWQKARSDEQKESDAPRELIADLAQIDWREREVWIGFDRDSRRNPSVNHAAAELARVLSLLGAHV
jgi:hypothetical protein